MRRLRFNIASLLVFVLILGIGFAALRESSELWDSGLFTLTLGVLLVSILLSVHRTVSRRAFWLGFALFGWTYLALSQVPSIESRLATTKLLAYLDSKVPGRTQTFFTGTFEDVTATVGLDSDDGTIFLNRSAGPGLGGTSESFMRIGHSLVVLIVALLGGLLSQFLHEKDRQNARGQDIPQTSTSLVGTAD
jgi:hypothetical protein